MRHLFKPFQWLYCLYAFLLFVICMFLVLPFVIIGSFFGSIRGGNFIYRVCHTWADVWIALVGMHHWRVKEAPYDETKQYVYVANHISYMDIPQIMKAVRKPFRVLGKEEMVKVPVFGFIYKSAVVTVDRTNPEKRSQSVRRLKAVLRSGISIFIFPEGTFNMREDIPLKEFYDGAFRLAIETQTPIKPLVFADTIDRMHFRSLLTLTPGKLRTIYLEEVPVAGLGMSDIPMLKEKVYRMMDASLRRCRQYQEPAPVAD